MGIEKQLEVVCQSKKWDLNELDGLSLTGLQPCFEDVVLLAPVYICFLGLGSWRISQCLKATTRCSPKSTSCVNHYPIKLLLCATNALCNLVLLGLIDQPADYELLVNLLGFFAWCTATGAVALESRRFSLQGQWVLRFIWLWVMVATCIRWPSQQALGGMPQQHYYFSVYVAQFVSTACLVLGSYFEKPTSAEDLAPASPLLFSEFDALANESSERLNLQEGVGNVFSVLVFSWLSPLLSYGYRNQIEERDLGNLRTQFQAGVVSDEFERAWIEEKLVAKRLGRTPSLVTALFRAFGPYFMVAAPMLAVQNIAQLSLPFLLGYLVRFIDNDEPAVNGYLYSMGLLIGLMIMTIAENQYFDRAIKTGIKIRAAMVTTIFKHALRMTNAARQERSVGSIVNHMATDTEKLQMECLSFHNLWSSPLRIILGLYLLVSNLGWAGVIGFAAVVLLLPLQTVVMKRFATLFGAVMKRSDSRIKILNEILGGMRVIKYYAWEDPFATKIRALRDEELTWLERMQRTRAYSLFLMGLNPVALAVGTFVAFALLEGNITPAQAFLALALFQQLLWPLMLLPRSVSEAMETLVSTRRIQDFLLCEAVDDIAHHKSRDEPTAFEEVSSLDGIYLRSLNSTKPRIEVTDGTFQWGTEATSPTLLDVNIQVNAGELVAIVGATGSGKSSLISAMLGEMVMVHGKAQMSGTVAYVPQQAWIFNATVKENILFGTEYDPTKYADALRVSNLVKDIEHQFAAGDHTEIGEKGINLSGGQRQRVNIARAVYADADIYLFDDPLSALDAHVCGAVFRDCIQGYLKDKIRILVTNQLYFMPQVDRIIFVSDGRIIETGTFQELMAKQDGAFAALYRDQSSTTVDTTAGEEKDPVQATQEAVTPKTEKQVSAAVTSEQHEKGKLIVAEGREQGRVKWSVYTGYADSIGAATFSIMIIMYVLANAANVGSSTWLAFWSTDGSSDHARHISFYIGIYVALSVTEAVCGLTSNIIGFSGAVRASRVLHSNLVGSLLRSPMFFFDSTPLGRIVNRFSKDMNQVDTTIMFNLQLLTRSACQILGTIVVIGMNTTYVLVPFVPIVALFVAFQNYYRTTSVQLKRMDAVSRSPVYAHFTESLAGIATIRAYAAQERMAAQNAEKLNVNQQIYLLFMTSNRWLSIRLESLGGLIILAAALNCVILRDTISAAAAGIAMAYGLQITTQLNMLVRFVTETENSFNAVERVLEYVGLESEAPRRTNASVPDGWPSSGRIEFSNVVMSYRKGLPPVLKGISVTIKPCEKVGVVGRTGAGKSSLFQSLFRLVEVTSGAITFDGVDISALGLDDVRRALSIIPQEPVLFSGTLRFNLDPFDQYPDAELWDALEKANLKKILLSKGEKLTMAVAENGENFSTGQRQLICLARALLRRTKILVLDEATANVDVETDALIQKTIRENFADRTTLTIAHRLNTIIDSDKVLVLELGQVKEFDTPANLLRNPKSEFTAMVNETGPQNAAFLKSVALGEAPILPDAPALIQSALTRLGSDWTPGQLPQGPLMRAVQTAANTLRSGFEDRRAPAWLEELQQQSISAQVWTKEMLAMLTRINQSAQRAIEEDHLDSQTLAEHATELALSRDLLVDLRTASSRLTTAAKTSSL